MRFLLIATALVAGIYFSGRALAHGEYEWVSKYNNGNNINCCDKFDVVPITHEMANAASVGSVLRADFPYLGEFDVTVSRIYQTEDHHGRPLLSRYGCLFRHFGG